MNISQMLDSVADALEMKTIRLEGGAYAEIAVVEGFSIHLTRIDDTSLELSTPLPQLKPGDPALLRALMEANFLGAATGSGRLAIDSGRNEVLFCERLDGESLSAEGVRPRVRAFLARAAFWRTEGTDLALAEARKASPQTGPKPDAAGLIRI